MGLLSGLSIRRMASCLENKLGINFGSGKHPSGWYYLDGKRILHVIYIKSHSGQDISPGVASKLKNSLKLSNSELKALYSCPMTGKQYENKIRDMGVV